MPVTGRLTTKGFDEFLERIAEAGRSVDDAADRALAAGGQVALEGMDRRVPKDTHHLESRLFVGKPQANGNYHFVEVGLDLSDRSDLYGIFQEYGTARMAAHPYIRPTFDEDKAKIRAAIRKSLEEDGTL